MAKPIGEAHRWIDVQRMLLREGRLAGPGFEPGSDVFELLRGEHVRLLVIGAGGLGCELLKDLALLGFVNIDVIDMDTIDLTNLNRQFLFREQDIGQSKAICAARAVNERVEGVKVTPHFCRIEDKPPEWYREFSVIVLGLDSVEARGWMNSVACSFLEYGEDGEVDQATIKPMVDGGTEGFTGHARVIYPGLTPCFQCTMWLFPPQTKFPLCTIAETPRSAAHCIEYAHLVQFPAKKPFGEEEPFDADKPRHMQWVFEAAAKRATAFGIEGVTLAHTKGVVKNIVPAIPSTNAIIASLCAQEVLKMVTVCARGLDNFFMYNGSEGVYGLTVAHEKDPHCVVCSSGLPLALPSDKATLRDVLDALRDDPRLPAEQRPLLAPSVSCAGTTLYFSRPEVLEAQTRHNLDLPLAVACGTPPPLVLVVTDKRIPGVLRVRVQPAPKDATT